MALQGRQFGHVLILQPWNVDDLEIGHNVEATNACSSEDDISIMMNTFFKRSDFRFVVYHDILAPAGRSDLREKQVGGICDLVSLQRQHLVHVHLLVGRVAVVRRHAHDQSLVLGENTMAPATACCH